MKKFLASPFVRLCLPVLFIVVAGILISGYRERKRKSSLVYYSKPFKPQIKLERAQTPVSAKSGAGLGLFGFEAHCLSSYGSRQPQWWIGGQLFDVSGATPQIIWGSQTRPRTVTFRTCSLGWVRSEFNKEAIYGWSFTRNRKDKRKLRLVVEAVAVPIDVPENEFASHMIDVRSATPAQIAAIKQQADAKYFRESIDLNASENSKYQRYFGTE